ncbi:MAG: serine/threonine-protein phosphatase [Deltaproteobacteria bacterium]|jgi:hypothetical protein|nr:serine/threonine-protein phosphatase [Deltaproteobacteria bacterium]
MFVDVSCSQETKRGQNTSGDFFVSRRHIDEGRVLAVLSDGLGSGVKASILSRMTATMLLGFVEERTDLRTAAELVIRSLPVCKARGLNYSTFSVLDCDDEGRVRVLEEGNPEFLWFRGGLPLHAPFDLLDSEAFPDRRMRLYEFEVLEGDRLIFVTDGVTQAGLGRPGPKNPGLGRQGLSDFVSALLQRHCVIDSQRLAKHLTSMAVGLFPDRLPTDDVSAAVAHFRVPRRCLVFTGPPFERSRDPYYAEAFAAFKGPKAICGGTTAQFLARELNLLIKVGQGRGGGLPPESAMEGVELVTEGLLTLTRAIQYLETNDLRRPDPAGALVRFMLAHDIIHVMEGTAVNVANFDPSQTHDLDIRRNVIKRMAQVLQTRHLKMVRVQRV